MNPITNPAAAVAEVHEAIKVASPALRTGLYTGALLIIVMTGSLVAANRLSWLDNRALERNAASYGLFVIFMLIPICRFLNRPVKMFVSAMIGWVHVRHRLRYRRIILPQSFRSAAHALQRVHRRSDRLRRVRRRLLGRWHGPASAPATHRPAPPPLGFLFQPSPMKLCRFQPLEFDAQNVSRSAQRNPSCTARGHPGRRSRRRNSGQALGPACAHWEILAARRRETPAPLHPQQNRLRRPQLPGAR